MVATAHAQSWEQRMKDESFTVTKKEGIQKFQIKMISFFVFIVLKIGLLFK